MQICETVRSDVLRRKLRYYCGSQATLVLIQLLGREPAVGWGTNAPFREIQMIAFVDAPRLEGRLREDNPSEFPMRRITSLMVML